MDPLEILQQKIGNTSAFGSSQGVLGLSDQSGGASALGLEGAFPMPSDLNRAFAIIGGQEDPAIKQQAVNLQGAATLGQLRNQQQEMAVKRITAFPRVMQEIRKLSRQAETPSARKNLATVAAKVLGELKIGLSADDISALFDDEGGLQAAAQGYPFASLVLRKSEISDLLQSADGISAIRKADEQGAIITAENALQKLEKENIPRPKTATEFRKMLAENLHKFPGFEQAMAILPYRLPEEFYERTGIVGPKALAEVEKKILGERERSPADNDLIQFVETSGKIRGPSLSPDLTVQQAKGMLQNKRSLQQQQINLQTEVRRRLPKDALDRLTTQKVMHSQLEDLSQSYQDILTKSGGTLSPALRGAIAATNQGQTLDFIIGNFKFTPEERKFAAKFSQVRARIKDFTGEGRPSDLDARLALDAIGRPFAGPEQLIANLEAASERVQTQHNQLLETFGQAGFETEKFEKLQRAGKQLDKETARQILQEAGGDKNRAREIARRRGYKF